MDVRSSKYGMEQVRVPQLVKRLRKRLGLTQEQLARLVGVTFSTVNQWENGRRTPMPFLLKRLIELDKHPPRGSSGTEGTP